MIAVLDADTCVSFVPITWQFEHGIDFTMPHLLRENLCAIFF